MTKSNSIAMALIERGITKSDIIMTYAENSIDLVIALIASILLGVTIYPISASDRIYEIQTLLQSLASITIFATKTTVKIIEKVLNRSKVNENQRINVRNIIVLDGVSDNYLSFEELMRKGLNKSLNRIPYFNVDPKSDTFILLQSSGTSGPSKSVMVSHFAFALSIQTIDLNKKVLNPIFNQILPFGCRPGLPFLLANIAFGVPAVIDKEFSERLILKSIEKYRVNAMMSTPKLVYELIDEQNIREFDLSSLRFFYFSGAAIDTNAVQKLIDKFGVEFRECKCQTNI